MVAPFSCIFYGAPEASTRIDSGYGYRMLHISVLGSAQLVLNGQEVTHFHFERVRALLFYLAVEIDTTHDRMTLATLLWPDAAPKTALENLRQVLASLRRVLNNQQQTPPFLLITTKTIRFNPASAFVLDYADFNRLLKPPYIICTVGSTPVRPVCTSSSRQWHYIMVTF